MEQTKDVHILPSLLGDIQLVPEPVDHLVHPLFNSLTKPMAQ